MLGISTNEMRKCELWKGGVMEGLPTIRLRIQPRTVMSQSYPDFVRYAEITLKSGEIR